MIGGFHGRRVICAAAQEIHQLVAAHAHRADKIDDFKVLLLGALGFQLFQSVLVLGDFAAGLWSSLNVDNKVSLFARVIDLDTGESGDMIYNKYDSVCSDLDDPEEPELLPEELELLKKLDAEEK